MPYSWGTCVWLRWFFRGGSFKVSDFGFRMEEVAEGLVDFEEVFFVCCKFRFNGIG
jgi:hypothetical protein